MDIFKTLLNTISELLKAGGEQHASEEIIRILNGTDEEVEEYLVSNELWGGAGSIADQSLISNREYRKQLETLLISLAEEQEKIGIVNCRTESWLGCFRNWRDENSI